MLQALFESALDAIVVFDDERRFVELNPAGGRLFGVAPEQLRRRRLDEFIADDAGRLDAAWQRLLAKGHDSGDTTVRTADGRLVHVEYRARARFLPGRHLAVLRDVGERIQAQRELAAQAEFLRRLIESSHDCIKVLDLDGRLLSMNDGGRRLLEIDDLATYLGTSWVALWTGGDAARAADAVDRARKGEATRFEGFAVTAAGTPRWWETAVAPILGPAGRPERLLAVSRDVTARVQAEHDRTFLEQAMQALAASLDHGTTLATIAGLAVPYLADFCFLDVIDGDTLRRPAWAHADPGWQGRFDEVARYVPRVDAPGHPVAGVIRETRTRLVPEVTETWIDEAAMSPAHARFMRALGMRSLISVPLRDPARMLAGVLTLGTSHSGRRLEASHVALAEQFALRAVLALKNAEIYQAARRAHEMSEALVRAKDEFLAVLAHELRNPLGAILNSASALDRIGAQTPPARQARGVIQRQAAHMAGLLDDLLDIARIGQGKIELRLEQLDLRRVVEDVLEADGHRFTARRQAVTLDAAPEPIVVQGDRVRLRQIVANIIGNASKYTPPGGSIAVRVLGEPGAAILRVRDSGIGIPAEKLEAIFELFTQLTPSPALTEGSLGIGLTLVRRLTDLHGGTVVAHSDGPGQGSEFVVRLPRTGH